MAISEQNVPLSIHIATIPAVWRAEIAEHIAMGCGASKIVPLFGVGREASADDGKVVCLTASDRAEVAQVVGRAFAGTSTLDPEWVFHWALGPQLPDRGDPQRAAVIEFILHVQMCGMNNMHMFGVKGPDGKLQSVNYGYRSPGGGQISMCAMVKASFSIPAPPAYKKMHAKFDKRFSSLDKVMNAANKKHMPGPHYHTTIVAVDPPSQNNGQGALLMNALFRMADAEGLPCYLECSGKRTRDFYIKYGYVEKECFTVGIAKDDDGHASFAEFYAMVRPAKAWAKGL